MAQVCVTLGFAQPAALLAEHRRLVEAGVSLVEWRIDHLQESVDVAALVAKRPGPVVFTVRREPDGGVWQGAESTRRDMLRAAVAAAVEYVDVEPDTIADVPRKSATRRIVSIHDFHETPADLEQRHAQLASLGAEAVKLATMARSTHDVTRMLRVMRQSRVPTVGLCMGELGTPSRILSARCGAPFTYAALEAGVPLAPGQISFRAMLDLYRYEQMTSTTPVYGVIGDPIGHSKSPLVHNTALHEAGLPGVYVPFRVPTSDLPTFLDDARELGLRGLSVTIPHKEGVLSALTHVDDDVRQIGACNTLVFNGAQTLGYNTDWRAAIDAIAVGLGRTADTLPVLNDCRALVLGAGGAAKAIVYGLRRCGAGVHIASRTRERAAEVATQLGAAVLDWDARHTLDPQVIVNCTPLGMEPHVEATPYDAAALTSGTVVFDTVYTPEITRLLADARVAGCITVTGIEMFIRQAVAQFRLFTGFDISADSMRKSLAKC